jgi:hypothetical protein
MLTLIILGFVLFIVGVAVTMFHDALKVAKQKQADQRAALRNSRPPKSVPAPPQTARQKAQSLAELFEQSKTTTKTTTKKANSKATFKIDANDAVDMSLEDLIKQVESMKKNR